MGIKAFFIFIKANPGVFFKRASSNYMSFQSPLLPLSLCVSGDHHECYWH